MNAHLQHIQDALQQIENLTEEQSAAITKSLKAADKELTILEFKLDRTEKVKRTTAILLEETIEELEQKRKAVEDSNLALQKSLEDLKAAQEQLVQQEKLASLGQLTAGIAHEIKNPLNFVNNFSSVSVELVDELLEDLESLNSDVKSNIDSIAAESNSKFSIQNSKLNLEDIKNNLTKIVEHGTRADGIVKSMLQHSRGGSGKLEATDLNALVKEYVNLAFHGMRAGKDPINVEIDLKLDESIGKVPLIVEDFSRVILNLCTNAFDAMREKGIQNSKSAARNSASLRFKIQNYNPKLTVSTNTDNGIVVIKVQDNGLGIPDEIKDKILQPFFTTKKGTQGTGLGLSITHDIIKAHGGELEIATTPGTLTCFIIKLPNN